MLSKVAERIYWTARYLERVESTARMINIYDQLLFDTPRSVRISWYNLVVINDLEQAFGSQYTVQDERNVVKFLVADDSNPSSLVSSLRAIRENVRTTRDVVLEETWEQVNELSLYVQDNLPAGIGRNRRHAFLQHIIHGCQQILGLLYGSMPHDAAWDFLRLGRNLERADMTTRNLDAAIAAIAGLGDEPGAVNSSQMIWGTLLRSLNADLSYRRKLHLAVQGAEVVRYLLEDDEFPRAIAHCLDAMIDSAGRLPKSRAIQSDWQQLRQQLFDEVDYAVLNGPLHQYLNTLQGHLAGLHRQICETWFPAG
ncbi:MAG TPA: alpha-E domain-containing protein [Pseudomonadales bacterium]